MICYIYLPPCLEAEAKIPSKTFIGGMFRILLKVGTRAVSKPLPLCSQVYGASNVELITRTRTEHLSEQHKGKVKGNELEAHGGGCRMGGSCALKAFSGSPVPGRLNQTDSNRFK